MVYLNLAVLWFLALGMAAVAAYVIRRATIASSPFDVVLVLFLLGMMGSMAGGFLLYESSPGVVSLEVALFSGMWVMVIGLGYLLATLVADRKWEEGRRLSLPFRASVIVGALTLELVMSFALAIAAGDLPVPARSAPIYTLLGSGLASKWFLLPMALEMGLSVWLARRDIPTFLLVVLSLQPLIMLLSPTAFPALTYWVVGSVLAGGSAMTIVFVFVMESFYRRPSLSRPIFEYLVVLCFIFAAMMAGLSLWTYNGMVGLFALGLVAEMALFFNAILLPDRLSAGEAVPYREQAWPMFSLIFGVFLAEFFMGALFDFTLDGPTGFLASLPLPLVGVGPSFLPATGTLFYDVIAFATGVLGSVWFLIMMGAEMGALIVFKIRETRHRETRVRLSLILGAYSIYAILLPSFVIPPTVLPSVPLVGWSMGFGTGGGFIPPLFLVLAFTYLIAGTLSLLFGARQMCSTLCTAAMMYQGTFYDSLKGFNRRSHVGNKLLGSRLSRLYGVIFSLSWVSIMAAGAISYLNYVGVLHLTVYGTDVAYATEVIYFNLIWYLLFISIPFVGVYACVSTGYCYWGTFNQILGRLGFFRLKARDPSTCVTCPTHDCTRACPVGLTDLPPNFIAKGEFRALKCIGVGDCVESCPYDNITFWDVRHWVREKLGGSSPKSRPVPLRMTSPSPKTSVTRAQTVETTRWDGPAPR